MHTFLLFPVAFVLAVLLLVAIFEGSKMFVVGRFIPEKRLVAFLAKHLPGYQLLSIEVKKHNMMVNHSHYSLPYISKSMATPLSRWYIQDFGMVPRWSPASKILDRRFANLLQEAPKVLRIDEI